jgi:hypothetical protein
MKAFTVVTVFAFVFVIGAIGWATSPIDEVRAAYAACRDFAARTKMMPYERPYDGVWRRGTTLERGEFASLWLEGQTVRVANLQTGGEDNAITVRYCFRRDGTLAFMHTTLGTFYADPGPVRVERRLYFDPRGQKFRETEQVYDAKNKPVQRLYGGFALQFERVFLTSNKMRAFFGRALKR